MEKMTIGPFAKLAGVGVETIRSRERQSLSPESATDPLGVVEVSA